MNSACTFLSLCVVLACTVTAQHPVPTRVRTEIYGPRSGYPDPLDVDLQLDVGTAIGPRLRLTGGMPGEIALIALGLERALLRLPQTPILLVEPLVVVPGSFDSEGAFSLALSLTEPSFVGHGFCAQGIQYVPVVVPRTVEYFQFSSGVAVDFVAGNEQPPLSYAGPTLRATPIATRVQDLAATLTVLHEVEVPTSGYELRLESVQSSAGTTSLYLVLVEPAPDEVVIPVIERKLLAVELGDRAEATIDVLVERRVRGTVGMPVFTLAARILRDY